MSVCSVEEMTPIIETKDEFITREQRLALSDAISGLLRFKHCGQFEVFGTWVPKEETDKALQVVINLYNLAYPE